jgi:preprotein translocase subunit YajC
MEPLIILAVTFVLLWALFILPQQRRVRAHQALVASLKPGDQVVLTAGIHGRIVELGPEDMLLEVAPGVALRVARPAVLRRLEDRTAIDAAPREGDGAERPGEPDVGTDAPEGSDLDHRGPQAPGPDR